MKRKSLHMQSYNHIHDISVQLDTQFRRQIHSKISDQLDVKLFNKIDNQVDIRLKLKFN